MRDAVIVSTARTPIGRAYRGAFNDTPAPTLAAHALTAAVERAGRGARRRSRTVSSAARCRRAPSATIGRMAALRAGLPVTVAGMTMDRQCSSGLMAIATAAKQIIVDRMDIDRGRRRGVDHAGPDARRCASTRTASLVALHADAYMPMLDTAEVVAARYGISREACDEYALASQQRTAAAQAAGRLDAEIVPVTATDEASSTRRPQDVTFREVTLRTRRRHRARDHAGGPRRPQGRCARAARSRRATPASFRTAPRPAC